MEDTNKLYEIQESLTEHTESTFHRYLYSQINWDNRLISFKGARGTGKTIMLLQRIKEHFHASNYALYVSLDNLWR